MIGYGNRNELRSATGGETARRTAPVRLAMPSDRASIAVLFARAFAADPAFAYIYPDPALRARLLPRLFRLFFDSDGENGFRLAVLGGDGTPAAASFWRPPGQSHVGWSERLRRGVPLLAAFRSALGRALRVGDAVDAHHPSGDYWYLHMLGCDPAWQRAGFGSAAVAAGLALTDNRPCYLETANEDNLGFYATLGFEVTAEWDVPRGGPHFWSMLRRADLV